MSPEKTKLLFDRYPLLYRGKNLPITQNLMAFGFEHGDGWFEIIDQLSKKIDIYARNHKLSDEEYPMVMQVKEKFGSLRYYMAGMPECIANDVYAVIDEAEDKSGKTCELCGNPGEVIPGGWITVRCKTCAGSKGD